MPDLSIITVNANNKEILKNCLASIYQHTNNIIFEIIVIDNASTDGSKSMIRSFFPQVILIENPENKGFSKASNQGLIIAQGRYCLLLNDDTYLNNNALELMVDFMDKNPMAGACGAKLLNTDKTIQRQGGLFGKKFWLAKTPTAVDFVIGAALMVKKEVIDKIGLMDENLFFYNDDLDWCMSIRKAGWKIYFLPQAIITHYGGYSSKKKFNPRLFIEGFKGGLYFCRKHYGEISYHIYRLILGSILLLCLPFLLFSPIKLKAYWTIILISWLGQIPIPV